MVYAEGSKGETTRYVVKETKYGDRLVNYESYKNLLFARFNEQLENCPDETIKEKYSFDYSYNDGKIREDLKDLPQFSINPVPKISWNRAINAVANEIGGFDFPVESASEMFTKLEWTSISMKDAAENTNKSYGSEVGSWSKGEVRDAIYFQVQDKNTGQVDSGYIFFASDDSNSIATISDGDCSGGFQRLVLDPNKAPVPVLLRKPVIYLYPPKKQAIKVQLSLDGKIIADYPKLRDNQWNVIGHPHGEIIDPETDRSYNYLFWEGISKTPFEIDLEKSFCVPGSESVDFLEDALSTLGLNDKEKNDFITYWMPILESNKFNIIQFLEEEYERYAQLQITPQPDSLIRVFMIFKSSEEKIKTGHPTLSKVQREGFVALEWGGADISPVRDLAGINI